MSRLRMSQLPAADNGDLDAIAIVGVACRFSGLASSPEGLWQLLSKGMTSWSNKASSRFKLDSFWHPESGLGGSVSTDAHLCVPKIKPLTPFEV